MLQDFFGLKQHKTTVRTELMAGLTTFMTMAYILIVNPHLLSATGMDSGALFTATALSAGVATLVMAFWARLPFALAPGMGLNAFFAFTVVLGMGHSWQFALTAVFVEGIIFIILTAFNIREAIINSIPMQVKYAVSVGIGLFITLIGLSNAGIVQTGMAPTPDGTLSGTLVAPGNMTEPGVILALIGLLFTGFLLIKKVKGALLIGIFTTTLLGIPFGVTQLPDNFSPVDTPPSVQPLFFQFEFHRIFTLDFAIVLFTFLFVDLFDTVGTLIGVGTKANMLDKDGRMPRAKQALFADAIGTTFGAVVGTSTVTTYIESASGVAEGGRTGLTALTVAILFLLSLFLAPLFAIIPPQATAQALVLVGLFMLSPVTKIDFSDYTQAIPAFLTMVMMPFAYSIAEGIIFGMLSYVILMLTAGKYKQLSPMMYVLAVLFILKFFI